MADVTQSIMNGVATRWHDQGDGTNAQQMAAVMAVPTVLTATIANGTALSGIVDLVNARLATIYIPAAWTTANLTFQTSADGINFFDRYDSFGVEYTLPVGGASRSIKVPLDDFLGVRYLKVRSGTTGAPVNQTGADRVLALMAVR